MAACLVTVPLGLLIVVLGICNMMGNISSLHEYHRHRVAEEDRKPFGKRVGLGTVLIGAAVAMFGILFFIFEKTSLDWLVWVATAQLIVCIVVGTIISFRAMIKYNGGIF